MRKEIVYAIIAGVLFGLVVAFSLWRTNLSINEKKGAQTENNTAEETSPSPAPDQISLTLAKPQDLEVSDNSLIDLNGLTAANTWVAISGENNDYLLQSSPDGSFSQEVELSPGVNEIVVLALAGNGQSASSKVVVVYSSEFEIPPTDNQATESADTIRQKVQDKVDKVLKSPRAYIGTITDISEGTIQITKFNFDPQAKAQKEIKQISISSGTDYAKIQKADNKTIKFSDVAIGDFIVAMGFVNGNSVLEAQRVLVTDPYEITTRTAHLGLVSSLSKTKIKIKPDQTGTEIEVVPGDKAKITKDLNGKTVKALFTEVEETDKIIVLGQPDLKNFLARRIHILSSLPQSSPSPSPFPKPTQ